MTLVGKTRGGEGVHWIEHSVSVFDNESDANCVHISLVPLTSEHTYNTRAIVFATPAVHFAGKVTHTFALVLYIHTYM